MELLSAAGVTRIAGCAGGGGATTEETTATPSEGRLGGRLQAGWLTGRIGVLDQPVVAVLAAERDGLAAGVDAVALPEVGVFVLREQTGERVVDREVREQADPAPAESHVHEALCADRALV